MIACVWLLALAKSRALALFGGSRCEAGLGAAIAAIILLRVRIQDTDSVPCAWQETGLCLSQEGEEERGGSFILF
jgi:hypothetical protein